MNESCIQQRTRPWLVRAIDELTQAKRLAKEVGGRLTLFLEQVLNKPMPYPFSA